MYRRRLYPSAGLLASFWLACALYLPTAYGAEDAVGGFLQKLRQRVASNKYYWDTTILNQVDWKTQGQSVNGLPLIYWSCGDNSAANRSLVLSVVHGDEITPLYFGFRLVEYLKLHPEICKDKLIVIAPVVNPDGFLRYSTGTRTNFNKVDLNRNFDTPDWRTDAHRLWKSNHKSQRRYFPGDQPNSEPETKFQVWLINEFNPTYVMSVHAPLNFIDFDGPIGENA